MSVRDSMDPFVHEAVRWNSQYYKKYMNGYHSDYKKYMKQYAGGDYSRYCKYLDGNDSDYEMYMYAKNVTNQRSWCDKFFKGVLVHILCLWYVKQQGYW